LVLFTCSRTERGALRGPHRAARSRPTAKSDRNTSYAAASSTCSSFALRDAGSVSAKAARRSPARARSPVNAARP
jgi:hypothetical protein